MAAAESPQPATAKAELREYVVLRGIDDRDAWATTISGPVRAVSADAAIKQAADGEPGTYVAVPQRSWQPRTVKVITEKRTVLS